MKNLKELTDEELERLIMKKSRSIGMTWFLSQLSIERLRRLIFKNEPINLR